MEILKNIFKNLSKLKKSNFENNKKIVRYLSFVVIATIFWFLNTLSKDYTTVVSYPVNYVGFPEDKALIKELPDKLYLEVKGYGFALLRYKISTAFLPITFNINSYTDNKLVKNNILNHTIHTNKIKNKISRKLSKDIHIIKISPDTIGLHFSKIIEKRIPIKPLIEASYANQYSLNGNITVTPDSVSIYAPSVIADTIKYVYTKKLTFENLDKSIKRNVLLKQNDGIRYSFKRTVVNIPIDQFIESSKEIRIEVKNLPENYKLRLFPDKIKLNYRVGLSNYNKITEDQFKITVDYNHINKQSNILKVNIEKYPPIISNIKISPSKVESIIEKINQ